MRFLLTLLLLTATLWSQNMSDEAAVKTYGEELTLTDTVLISQLMASPQAYIGKRVLVKGVITDVCKKRGCWISLASDAEYQEIVIKVTDGEIVFPVESRGKMAIAEGVFEAIELSLEQAQRYLAHRAEENGKAFDPSTVTGPITIYRIKGTGARI
jgi:hypothetical protein